MKLKPYYDFCFDEHNVYLTPTGKSKLSYRYVSPSKIINFFSGRTEFEVWKSLFLPDRIELSSTTEKENYFLLEEEIRDYLKDRSGLNLDFFGYGFWEENVFPKREGVESKLGEFPMDYASLKIIRYFQS
ncbi:hypothetical protein MHF_0796 [Mycoplasma haemofelis Ohio2]|uniref:Uncharacterized protein n=1 Tax=Mycoplasma haemofelis (strain Ohio2) TaxID=859194 RepID=F6FIL5_MYCHI|nr:hypothetical protein MHF_0796 [Mycoplasma haemofelis Ohio2]